MSFTRYEPEELPGTISRMVRWRWPGDQLLVTVPCEAELGSIRPGWLHHLPGARPPPEDEDPEDAGVEPGVLGVTDARIVYQHRDRPGWAFRLAAVVFALLALVSLLARADTATLAVAVGLALLLGVSARVIEALGFGSGAVEFGRILEVNRLANRIHGVDRWGIHYHLLVPDPDFDTVSRLVSHEA
ncbi:MAG: hypothetical protein ACT4PO_04630 [Actinomycetota bacterium]